jgi:hypothetical protein
MWPSDADEQVTPPKFSRPDIVPQLNEDAAEPTSLEPVTETVNVVIVTTKVKIRTITTTATPSTTSVTVTATVTETVQAESKKEKEKPVEKCPSELAWRAKPLKAINTTFTVPEDIVYDPKGPKPHEIVFVTASDGKGHNGGIEDILGHTARNRKAYCDYHGYNYHFVNISKFDLGDVHPVWKKIPAIVDAFNTFPEAQWLFFLDLDAIIMNPRHDLSTLVLSHKGMQKALDFGGQWTGPERAPLGTFMQEDTDLTNLDMLIAQDQNGVNAGSFFLRRSKYTQWLLDMWADPFFKKMNRFGQEQEAILHFVKHHKTFREHTGMLKQRVANAYSEGDLNMAWQEGDLVVHFAGCWVPGNCNERWQAFWGMRQEIEFSKSTNTTDTAASIETADTIPEEYVSE